MIKAVLCVLQAFLFLVSSFSVKDSNFKELMDQWAIGLISKTQFTFDSISAEETQITDAEKARCRAWFEENILFAGQNGKAPAYDFTVGGKSLRHNLRDWTFSPGTESADSAVYRGGKTTIVTLTHKPDGLVAEIEATIYEDSATCEWTVFIKNTAAEKSPVIRHFYAADCLIQTGKTTLYVSNGSSSDNDDFELQKMFCNFLPMRFNANGGRSASFLPYFNFSGAESGVVLAVGWTGQWCTTAAQRLNGVQIRVRQEDFAAYLNADETVRSPLVSLSFYDGGNAIKGFNQFRNWQLDCVYPESAKEITTTGLAGEFSEATAEELIAGIRAMPQDMVDQVDFLWMDAGWYPKKTSWYDSVGTWRPDPNRFPNGIAPICEAAAERGMGVLLWYEPERCCAGTEVYNEAVKHDGWLIEESEDVNMVNLANDDACTYLGDLVAESLRENKITLYRQDFNFTPSPLWEAQDKAMGRNRTGITENHYVTNLYRYLDRLREVNPGLLIDNCASGGRRLDIEMSRRSIPLWRTDYNCRDAEGQSKPDILESTQVSSYGISFWMPLTGTAGYTESEYAYRSSIVPCSQMPGNMDVRAYMVGNYYPITYGGMRTDSFLAMQFGDGTTGEALIYKRADATAASFTVRLNGLEPDTMYDVYDADAVDTVYKISGKILMRDGIEIKMQAAPKASILFYEAVKA